MKREYTITIPITGTVTATVIAESEEQAVEGIYKLNLGDVMNDPSIDFNWDFCETIVEGNIFYGIQNKMEIEEGDEIEE